MVRVLSSAAQMGEVKDESTRYPRAVLRKMLEVLGLIALTSVQQRQEQKHYATLIRMIEPDMT
jgi:hypothetical protein